MRRFWTVVTLGILWFSLSVLDGTLAKRAQAVIDAAWAQATVLGPAPVWQWRVQGLEADVCNALTGGLWLSWVMPKSSALRWPPELKARVEGGSCRRSGGNTVVFSR
jgi:hypothetical protein